MPWRPSSTLLVTAKRCAEIGDQVKVVLSQEQQQQQEWTEKEEESVSGFEKVKVFHKIPSSGTCLLNLLLWLLNQTQGRQHVTVAQSSNYCERLLTLNVDDPVNMVTCPAPTGHRHAFLSMTWDAVIHC